MRTQVSLPTTLPLPAEPLATAVEPPPPPSQTYYDLPAIKPAPWRWYIPAYFYAGGFSGASVALALAAGLAGDHRFARRLHALATLGHVASGGLLIADLGRPARFFNMLRGFRPRSPMSVGSWILSVAGASGGLALVRPGRIAALASGGAGAMLSTYTGVLLGNTAVPVWQVARRRLPLWFASSSAASLASLLELAGSAQPMLRPYAAIAKAADLAGAVAVERAAAGLAGQALHEGRPGRMWRGARWLGIASLAASLWPGRGRAGSLVAGALGTASALLARFAIVEAGRACAAEPRATFEPQRARRVTS